MRKIVPVVLFVLFCFQSEAQIYKDSLASVEARVRNLLSLMTPEEKFRQLFMIPRDMGKDTAVYRSGLFGFEITERDKDADGAHQIVKLETGISAVKSAEAVNEMQRFFCKGSRLGIPMIAFDEALHGLVRSGATAFPQAIGLAATWDIGLMHKVSGAIAVECKSRGIRMVLSPVVNVATDVRWGRTEETYGEDPFLVAEMGVAFVSEFERNGIVATPKHFVANVGDGGRDSYPVYWNERLLREVYLPPFEACFKRGGARSVMTAYNSLDGSPCSANDWLLNQLLKKEWGFTGFVISDAGATGGANVLHFTAKDYPESAAKSINNGLDVIFQTSIEHEKLFIPPFKDGSIAESTLDSAVERVLRIKFRLGLFEHPYVDVAAAAKWSGNDAHRNIAKQAALESIVLLKNEDKTLPLTGDIRSIAVVGADAVEGRLGGYSGQGNSPVNILDGIKNRAGKAVEVRYAKGCARVMKAYQTVASDFLTCNVDGKRQAGLLGEYFNNITLSGKAALTRIDAQLQFQWTLYSPDPDKLTYDFYSVRWTGKLKVPESGRFKIGIDGNDGYRLYVDDSLLIDDWKKVGKQTIMRDYAFEKDKEYSLRVEYYEPTGNARFNLVWNYGIEDSEEVEIEKAVAIAKRSDVTIVVAGIEEGEFRDRAMLGLPGRQEELINRIALSGKPVVVVLVGGSAIKMGNWLGKIPAVMDVWYPGEEGGDAVAEVLFGDYNPAGRLPITFPVSEGQLPLVYNHKPTGRGDDYDDLTGQALFPFGYGLSYTSFEYSGLEIGTMSFKAGDSTLVKCIVTNSGKTDGDEVVQLYIHDELASVVRPITELKGFQRIHLKAGESRVVSFMIIPEMLSMWNIDMKKLVEAGDFRIMIGASSKDIRLRGMVKVVE